MFFREIFYTYKLFPGPDYDSYLSWKLYSNLVYSLDLSETEEDNLTSEQSLMVSPSLRMPVNVREKTVRKELWTVQGKTLTRLSGKVVYEDSLVTYHTTNVRVNSQSLG